MSTFETFSSIEVSRISKATLRQLQWWDERGVLEPRHSGHRRIYSITDALEVILLADLRTRGLSLQKIRRVILQIRKRGAINEHEGCYIMINIKGVATVNGAAGTLQEADRMSYPVFIVSIDRLVQRLDQYLGKRLLAGNQRATG